MPLAKPWKELSRTTIGRAPDRYGVYELGDGDGTVIEVDYGVLKQELKNALAYGEGEQVRWEATPSEERARELAREHAGRR